MCYLFFFSVLRHPWVVQVLTHRISPCFDRNVRALANWSEGYFICPFLASWYIGGWCPWLKNFSVTLTVTLEASIPCQVFIFWTIYRPQELSFNIPDTEREYDLRCFDTVFQRLYRYFSIALKVFFSLSDRYKNFTSNCLWVEICENVVSSKIDITMPTINKTFEIEIDPIHTSMTSTL